MPRRLSFWLAVGGVSILSQIGLQLAAASTKSPGLSRLANATHGANQS
jgi:hypothetical protein